MRTVPGSQCTRVTRGAWCRHTVAEQTRVYMMMTRPHLAARLCLLLLLSLQLSLVTSDSGDTYSGSGGTLEELQELQEVIPGTPGLDYPILAAVPPLPFSCNDKASHSTL